MQFGPPGGMMGDGPPRGGGGFGGGIGAPGGIGLWSLFAALFTRSSATESLKLLLYGLVIEFGRRLFDWASQRIILQPSVSARFVEGDPAYEWIMLYLTQENVWRKSRDFDVNARSTKRRWHVNDSEYFTAALDGADNADYVPKWDTPHVFRWRGYWVDVVRIDGEGHRRGPFGGLGPTGYIKLTFFTGWTLKVNLLAQFVEEARQRYLVSNRPRVTIHLSDSHMIGHSTEWGNVKTKPCRPLSTLALEPGVMENLLADVKEFLEIESWYVEAGIPHHRGYLLHGPPGTGKTSTIYALAGALGLEIYSLSLAAGHIDDAYLQRLAAAVPRGAILLIEDIDCAFSSREDEDEAHPHGPRRGNRLGPGILGPMGFGLGGGGGVTLSGLLNVIDGVGSDDGRIFFATTNYYDRLDPALVRPGRIDVKVEYKMATSLQARALFNRFFPAARFEEPPTIEDSPPTGPSGLRRRLAAAAGLDVPTEKGIMKTVPESDSAYRRPLDVPLVDLAERFANAIPPYEFSAAEIQGYLLICKWDPLVAVDGIEAWMEKERRERKEQAQREAVRLQKAVKREDEPGGARYQDHWRGSSPASYHRGPMGRMDLPPPSMDVYGPPMRGGDRGRGRGRGPPGHQYGRPPPPDASWEGYEVLPPRPRQDIYSNGKDGLSDSPASETASD